MIEVSVNHLLLQIESNSFKLSCIRFCKTSKSVTISLAYTLARNFRTFAELRILVIFPFFLRGAIKSISLVGGTSRETHLRDNRIGINSERAHD